MARSRGDELFFASEFQFHRTAGLERRERADIFGQHFLLSAEAAADPLAKDADTVWHQAEKETELLVGDVRSLAAGADVEPIVVEPRDRAVRLEVRMLHAMRGVSALVNDIRRLESSLDVADSAVNLKQDILRGPADARVGALVVDNRRSLARRLFGIEDRGQNFVVDLQ